MMFRSGGGSDGRVEDGRLRGKRTEGDAGIYIHTQK